MSTTSQQRASCSPNAKQRSPVVVVRQASLLEEPSFSLVTSSFAHSKENRAAADRPRVVAASPSQSREDGILFEDFWLAEPRATPVNRVVDVRSLIAQRPSFIWTQEKHIANIRAVKD